MRGNWQDYYWQDASRGHSAIAELLVTVYFLIDLLCIVCGECHKTVECPSVSLSVPSIDNSGGGFAAEVGRSRYRSIAAAAMPRDKCAAQISVLSNIWRPDKQVLPRSIRACFMCDFRSCGLLLSTARYIAIADEDIQPTV